MMLIVGAAEGLGLVKWGRWQSAMGQIKVFSMREALLYETAEMLLMAVVILAGAHFIKALGDTFHARNTYAQSLTVVIYGLSPVFLLRLLDVFPTVNLWLPWAVGIMLTTKILLHRRAAHHAARPSGRLRFVSDERAVAGHGDSPGAIHHRRLSGRKLQTGGQFHLRPRRPAAVLKMKIAVENRCWTR